MLGNEPQSLPGLLFDASDCLTNFQPDEVDDDLPPRAYDVNVGGRVVVRIDDDPETAEAQDRRHERKITQSFRFVPEAEPLRCCPQGCGLIESGGISFA